MTKQNFSLIAWIIAFASILFLGTTTQNVEAIENDLMYSKIKIDSLECVIEQLQDKNDSLYKVCKKKTAPVKKTTYKKPTKAAADYITQYLPYAKEAQENFGIPVSITLAQGMLESAYGTSKLAINKNNHFGIKCGYEYRLFDSVEACFIFHAKLLSKRYKVNSTSYVAWAHNLQKKGYAEDPLYAQKLIAKIQQNNLNQYDA